MKISIVLPCYNEELAIPEVVEACLRILENKDLKTYSFHELIVVDDGSTDESATRLSGYEKSIRVIKHPKNLGYGAAIKTGIAAAEGDAVAIFDLDSTCKASDLHRLAEAMVLTQADMIVGQRMSPESGMPIVRSIGNFLFSSLTKLIFNAKHHDVCSGYRLFNKSTLEQYLTTLNNDLSFCLGASLKFLVNGHKIESVPVNYGERTGTSKLSALKEGPQFLTYILNQWIFHRSK